MAWAEFFVGRVGMGRVFCGPSWHGPSWFWAELSCTRDVHVYIRVMIRSAAVKFSGPIRVY